MVFTVIEPAPGLAAAARRRARRTGPSAVSVRTSYPSLLAGAGFVEVERIDATSDYRATQAAWITATMRHADAAAAAMGSDAVEQRLVERRAALAAIDDGILRRSLYDARRR